MNVRFWPILLKKSVSISTAEKYASEIEIRVWCKGSGLRFYIVACKNGIFTTQCRLGRVDYFQQNRPIAVAHKSLLPAKR